LILGRPRHHDFGRWRDRQARCFHRRQVSRWFDGRQLGGLRGGLGYFREANDASFSLGNNLVVLFSVLKEIRHVQERVPIETDVYECGLHAGQHATDASFIDPTHQSRVGITLVIHLNQQVIFQHGDLGLVWRR
jgi:hypothetical protein